MKPPEPVPTLRGSPPVLRVEALAGWLVTGYDLCVEVLRNSDAFGSQRMSLVFGQMPEYHPDRFPHLTRLYTETVLFQAGAAHAQGRAFLKPHFAQDRTARALAFATDFLARTFVAARGTGLIDLQSAVADVLPLAIAAREIGLPVEDAPLLAGWLRHCALPPGTALRTAEDALEELLAYLSQVTQLSASETPYWMVQFLIAGSLTARDLLGVGFLAFIENQEELRIFREHPASAAGAVEETLRFTSPAQIVHRVALRDLDLGPERIRRGELVYPVLAAANRDPAVFEDPDRFYIERKNVGRHIAFGLGPHSCPGAGLARALAGLVFRETFQKLPAPRLAAEPIWRAEGITGRGLKSLPVAWD